MKIPFGKLSSSLESYTLRLPRFTDKTKMERNFHILRALAKYAGELAESFRASPE